MHVGAVDPVDIGLDTLVVIVSLTSALASRKFVTHLCHFPALPGVNHQHHHLVPSCITHCGTMANSIHVNN